MKLKHIAIAAVVLAGAVACFALYSCPLVRSEAGIRASLLSQTPLGSTSRDVRAFLDARGWLDRNYRETGGFLKHEAGAPPTVVGATSVCGHLGRYYLPLRTDVAAFWGFDTSDHLIDVWVWKTVDGL